MEELQHKNKLMADSKLNDPQLSSDTLVSSLIKMELKMIIEHDLLNLVSGKENVAYSMTFIRDIDIYFNLLYLVVHPRRK